MSYPSFRVVCVLSAIAIFTSDQAAAAPALNLQNDPPSPLIPVESAGGKPSGMGGALPQGWRDDSAWAEVRGEYLPEEFEGTRYLRIRVDSVTRGVAQLAAPFNDAKPGTGYEVRLSARAQRPTSFAVVLQQGASPYRQYWRENVRVGARNFEEIVLEIPPLPAMQSPLFQIQFPNAGTVDIRSLSIEPLAATPAPTADKEAKNLLRMSRFPLGPQNGLSLYREVSDETCVFAADENEFGPSGVPALRVNSGANKKFHFDGELIAGLRRGQPHTASVWVKGNGTLILSALSAKESNTKTEKERFVRIRPDQGWQRAELKFTAAGDTPNQFIRYAVKGDIWMDGFMVSPGEEVPPFAGQKEAEVALALPEGQASLAGIQFEEEPARLRWAVSGAPEGSLLKTKIATAAGQEADLPPIPLGKDFYQTGELDFAAIEGQPLGAFRINSAVFGPDDRQLSPWAERVVLRVKKPRYWGQVAPQSAFGQHIRPAKRHILMAKALGNNWARLHDDGAHITDWVDLEPEPGQWRWSDDDLQRYLDGHLSVLGQFSTAPKWASYLSDTGISGDGGYFGKYFLPKKLSDFANYVTTLAERYKGKITAYEVWNEPWEVKWFGVAYVEEDGRRKIVAPRDAAKRYTELCKAAFEAAKKVDPAITIVGLNSTSTEKSVPGPDGVVDGTTWSADVIKAGGLQWCDVASFHTYHADANAFPGDAATRAVQTAVGPNAKFPRIQKPVWMSEGASTVGGRLRFGLYKHTLPYHNPEDVLQLAESVLRYDLSMLANGVEKIFLYSMGDFEQGAAGTYRSGVTLDGSAHPAALGRATLAWHVDGLRFVRHKEIAQGVHAFFFEGEGRAVAVLAPRPDHAPYSLPAKPEIQAFDIWNNPVPTGSALAKETLILSMAGKMEDLQAALR